MAVLSAMKTGSTFNTGSMKYKKESRVRQRLTRLGSTQTPAALEEFGRSWSITPEVHPRCVDAHPWVPVPEYIRNLGWLARATHLVGETTTRRLLKSQPENNPLTRMSHLRAARGPQKIPPPHAVASCPSSRHSFNTTSLLWHFVCAPYY